MAASGNRPLWTVIVSNVQQALQLGHHAALGAQVLLGERARELLEQVALLPAQPPRYDHVDDGAQVPARSATQRGQPESADAQDLPGLGTGRDLDLGLPLQ